MACNMGLSLLKVECNVQHVSIWGGGGREKEDLQAQED
jgi:hypothetical protein